MRGVDLSGWRVAINGAEPVRAQTLRKFAATFEPYGFKPSAFNPCYGMAEATLLISGGKRGAGAAIRAVDRAGLQAGRVARRARGFGCSRDRRLRHGVGARTDRHC